MVSSLTNPNESPLGILIQHAWNHQLRCLMSLEYCSLDVFSLLGRKINQQVDLDLHACVVTLLE